MIVRTTDPGFHGGERAVQERAGVVAEAARLEGMLAPTSLSSGFSAFLAGQTLAVLVARDNDDRLWASPLAGRAGHLKGRGTVLEVDAVPEEGDPLRGLPADQAVAVIVPDLSRRRRVRVNGWLSASDGAGLSIEVAEAYGNCPAHITPRALARGPETPRGSGHSAVDGSGRLSPQAAKIVTEADTFFLGTQHPDRGADASHKGGQPGFVGIEGPDLLWPDYAGNNMFNSLGNLAVNPEAAVLFLDFGTGDILQLSGTARTEWRAADPSPFDTGRRVRLRPERGVLRTSNIRVRG